MGDLVVATFNLHAGVDGWGEPFDVVAACASIDADVLVLEESFTPLGGTSIADEVADALGYAAISVPLAPARRQIARTGGRPGPGGPWGPGWGGRSRSLRLELPARSGHSPVTDSDPRQSFERGSWDLAVLSRLPVRSKKVVDLPQLRRDGPRRQVVRVEIDVSEGPFTIAGTHLAHLSTGSPIQIRALGCLLSGLDGPGALVGDMNCFGPALVALLPGWRRAARGCSWPSWRPSCQPDHILVNAAVTTATGRVLAVGGSDHLPVRAELSW